MRGINIPEVLDCISTNAEGSGLGLLAPVLLITRPPLVVPLPFKAEGRIIIFAPFAFPVDVQAAIVTLPPLVLLPVPAAILTLPPAEPDAPVCAAILIPFPAPEAAAPVDTFSKLLPGALFPT